MNYSNMIEEKNLKKTFIVATLVSTLVGTFTASMALADKIQEKRDKSKQKATDGKQDNDIKQLEAKLKKLGIESSAGSDKKNGERKSQRSRSRSSSRSSSRRRRRRRDDYDDDAAYFAHSARRSRAMIEQTYQDNLTRMGQGFAHGDVITENKLQAQIIQLQQTVINVLQDALYSGRGLTEEDLQRLLTAQQAAREGSLDALEGRHGFMLADQRGRRKQLPDLYDQQHSERLLLEDAIRPLPRQSTFPARQSSIRSLPPPRRAESLPTRHSSPFCPYGEELQVSSRPLSPAFDPSADSRCRACNHILPLDSRDVWVFGTEVPTRTGERQKVRECRMPARFVVKSHTPDARFACVLCNQHRDVDCICRSVEALIKHLASEHTAEEFEGDADLVSVRNNSNVGRELVLA
ncbi:hypothetical protein LTR85_004050 [Meristemomyces frigidus]|nr:hypothetical protein LTR85_004050 [Meristemomyces frigidus]